MNYIDDRKLLIDLNLDWYDSLQTVNCINHPDKKARFFTGHLKCNKGTVIAGFCCEECFNTIESDDYGCYGEWKLKYGLDHYDMRKE